MNTLDVLIAEHRATVLRVSRRYARDVDEAEDFAQETWLRVSRYLGQFRGDNGCAIGSWIYGIAQRTAWSMRKTRRYGTARRECPLAPEALDHVSGQEGDCDLADAAARALALADSEREAADRLIDTQHPEAIMEAQQAGRELAVHIRALPEAMRAAWWLSVVEEWPYEAIAARQGVPIGTVRSRISRARDRLEACGYRG